MITELLRKCMITAVNFLTESGGLWGWLLHWLSYIHVLHPYRGLVEQEYKYLMKMRGSSPFPQIIPCLIRVTPLDPGMTNDNVQFNYRHRFSYHVLVFSVCVYNVFVYVCVCVHVCVCTCYASVVGIENRERERDSSFSIQKSRLAYYIVIMISHQVIVLWSFCHPHITLV